MGQKIITCNLCGSLDSKVMLFEDGINVVKCENCGFAYSQTLPRKVYERKETAEDIFVKTEKGKKKVYSQVLKILQTEARGSLIDVGCRTGNFMAHCEKDGFQPIIGVEISKKFAEFTRSQGFKVLNCRLEEAALPDQSFDIITYLETLEHIPTPVQELEEAYRILKHNGIIVVEVPNLNFQLLKVIVSRFFHIGHFRIKSHDHLVHFTDRTIRDALAKAGFHNIRTTLRVSYIGDELPIFFRVFSVLSYYFAKLVRLVSCANVSSAIIATGQKTTEINEV